MPRRDLIAIIVALSGVVILSWIYLFKTASEMSLARHMTPTRNPVWDIDYFWLMYLMWAVMMIGMMLPSAMPMILIYAGIARKSTAQHQQIVPTFVFVLGYLVAWCVFSLLATFAQYWLNQSALLSPMMKVNNQQFSSVLLIAAGLYQWLPIKNKCLQHCRSPVHFISAHWRPGIAGALTMGLSHGLYCLGCCWALMTLLFIGGVMNLLWIAIITLFVLLEKLLPFGAVGGRIMGLVMIGFGVTMSFI